jgi:hypothetical protein
MTRSAQASSLCSWLFDLGPNPLPRINDARGPSFAKSDRLLGCDVLRGAMQRGAQILEGDGL